MPTKSSSLAADNRRIVADGLEVHASDEWSVTMNMVTRVITLSPIGTKITAVIIEPDLAELFGDHPLADICRELAVDASYVAVRGVTTDRAKIMLAAAHTISDLRETLDDE